jgi:NAD(P)-dependent dehydrogenase (short-subunit alcohol dehydrogenase family)
MSMSAGTHGVLRGSRVLVTGGGRGIGRAIALICAEEGADVAVLSRTMSEVEEVADQITQRYGTRALSVCADVTDEDQVASAVSEVVAKFGGIDILVNNAGAACEKLPGHQQSANAFRQLLDINVVSALIVTSQVLNKCMLAQKAGSIINISSRAGKVCAHPFPPFSPIHSIALPSLAFVLSQ